MLNVSDVVNGYQITKSVSEGAFAFSYFGKKNGKSYFIKEYLEPKATDKVFTDFFNNQEDIIGRLNSMGSVAEKFVEHFVDDVTYYQVKEKLSGINLLNWLDENGELEDRVQMSVLLCGVIRNLHSNGIVHQDLKPAQVMLVDDEIGKKTKLGYRLILSDFDWSIPDGNMVQSVGTMMYQSPEHYRGEVPTEESDIFTVGVMIFELLTGQNPYDFGKVVDNEELKNNVLKKKIAGEPLELNPDISKNTNNIILRCLEPNPKKRPALSDIQKALLNKETGESESVPSSTTSDTATAAVTPPEVEKEFGRLNVECSGSKIIIFGDKEVGRKELKLFFKNITDSDGDPVYKYCDTNAPMLSFKKKTDESFTVAGPDSTKNYFILNGERITTEREIKKGEVIELYSTSLSTAVASFNIT